MSMWIHSITIYINIINDTLIVNILILIVNFILVIIHVFFIKLQTIYSFTLYNRIRQYKKIPRIKVLSNTRDYIYRYFFVLTTNNNAITCATHTTAMMIRAIGIFLEK